MATPRFGIEEEYDARYEGLDYSDVEFESGHPAPASQEDVLADSLASGGSQTGVIAALERAEALDEQVQRRSSTVADRIERKAAEQANRPKSTPANTVDAASLMKAHSRLSAAIAANDYLKEALINPAATAARLVLASASPAASKSTMLSKVAHALRVATKATSAAEIDALSSSFEPPAANRFSGELAAALEAAGSCEGATAKQEQAVRGLLRLATMAVTSGVLASSSQGGRKVRKLKVHGVPSVAQAATATVEAWKAAILAKDSKNAAVAAGK